MFHFFYRVTENVTTMHLHCCCLLLLIVLSTMHFTERTAIYQRWAEGHKSQYLYRRIQPPYRGIWRYQIPWDSQMASPTQGLQGRKMEEIGCFYPTQQACSWSTKGQYNMPWFNQLSICMQQTWFDQRSHLWQQHWHTGIDRNLVSIRSGQEYCWCNPPRI